MSSDVQATHIHKPTVLLLHQKGIMPTAAAARSILLAYWHLSAERGQPCTVSCKRIANELGADANTVRHALTRWDCVTRNGRNGERRRAWELSLEGTVCPAPQEQTQNDGGESPGRGHGVPSRGAACPVKGGRGVPSSRDMESRATTETRERNETKKPSEKASAPLLRAGAHASRTPARNGQAVHLGEAVAAILPETEQAPKVEELEPDRESIESMDGKTSRWGIGELVRYVATGIKTSNLTDTLNAALAKIPEEQLRPLTVYVLAKHDANQDNGWNTDKAAAVLTARCKGRMGTA